MRSSLKEDKALARIISELEEIGVKKIGVFIDLEFKEVRSLVGANSSIIRSIDITNSDYMNCWIEEEDI